MARKIGELFYELRASAEGLSKDLDNAERQFNRFTAYVKANPVAAVGGLAVAFAGVAIAAARAAEEVETAFRPVVALLDLNAEGAKALHADMVALSRASGESQVAIARLYKTIAENGAGGAANVNALAEAALKLAKVAGGDATALAGGLDAITDVFQIDPQRGEQIAAVLFDLAKGRAPLADVLAVIGKIGPAAQTMGIDFETATAAIVRLLEQGVPVKVVAARFQELAAGGTAGRIELERLGAAGVDTGKAMATLDAAVKTVEQSAGEQAKQVRANLSASWLEFGTTVLPPVTAALRIVNAFLGDANDRAAQFGRLSPTLFDMARNAGFRSPAASAASPVVSFSLTDHRILNDTVIAAETAAAAIARLTDQTRNLGELSVSQLQARQRELAALLKTIPAAGDAQRAAVQKLLDAVGEALPRAVNRAAAELDRLRGAAEQFNASVGSDSKVEQARLKLVAWRADVEKAGVVFDTTGAKAGEFDRLLAGMANTLDEITATESASALQNVQRVMEQANDAINARLALGVKIAEDNAQRAQDQARTLADAEAEAVALHAGTEAYAQYLRLRVQAQAVEEATRLAREQNRTLSAQEIINIRTQAAALFDAAQFAKELQAALNANNAGALAAALGDVASQATQIATSLGKGGEQLARMVGIIGPLLSGLQKVQEALVKIDADGNAVRKDGVTQTVGLGTALAGRNGKESQANALAGVLPYIGAIVLFADALDVFGTHARQSAAALRAAAAEFHRALGEFAITSGSELDAALRANIAKANELARQAAAAVGEQGRALNETFASSAELQAFIIKQIEKLGGAVRVYGQAMNPLITELQKLLAVTIANEEALRFQHAVQLVLADQNLEVRDLEAAGRTADAAALRNRLLQDAEVRAASLDTTEAGIAYTEHLKRVQAAETAAAAAAAELAEIEAHRAQVLSQLSDENDILGGTAAEKLQRGVAALSGLFGQLNGTDAGLDLDTLGGLESFRDRLIGQFLALEADGITAEEQPMVDAIKQILALIGATINELPETLDPAAQAIEAFLEGVKIFGTSLTEQFAGLVPLLLAKFGDALGSAGDFDIAGEGGLAGVKQRLRDKIEAILADGVITDEERPILDALEQLFAIVSGMLDDLASGAEDAAQIASDAAESSAEAARSAAEAARELANSQREFTDTQHEAFLRASGNTLEADLSAAERATAAAVARAQELGLGQGVINEILRTGELNLSRIRKDAAESAASAAESTAVAEQKIADAKAPKPDVRQFAAGISETAALSLASILQSQAVDVRAIRTLMERSAGLFVGGLPNAPTFPAGFGPFGRGTASASGGAGGAGGGLTFNMQFVFNNAPGGLSGTTPERAMRELAAQLMPQIQVQLGRAFGIERRLRGDLS